MAIVINLNRARKQRERERAAAAAAENRVRHGQSKAERSHRAAEAEEAARKLDALRREPPKTPETPLS